MESEYYYKYQKYKIKYLELQSKIEGGGETEDLSSASAASVVSVSEDMSAEGEVVGVKKEGKVEDIRRKEMYNRIASSIKDLYEIRRKDVRLMEERGERVERIWLDNKEETKVVIYCMSHRYCGIGLLDMWEGRMRVPGYYDHYDYLYIGLMKIIKESETLTEVEKEYILKNKEREMENVKIFMRALKERERGERGTLTGEEREIVEEMLNKLRRDREKKIDRVRRMRNKSLEEKREIADRMMSDKREKQEKVERIARNFVHRYEREMLRS